MEENSSRMEFLVAKVETLEKTIENLKCSMSKKIDIFSKFVQEHIQLQKKTRLAEENIFEKCSLELSLFEPDISNSGVKVADFQNEKGNTPESENESYNILQKTVSRQRKRKRGRDKTNRKSSKLIEPRASGDENNEIVDVDQMKVKTEIEEEDNTDFELENYNENDYQSDFENNDAQNYGEKNMTKDMNVTDASDFEIIRSRKSRELLVRKGYLFHLQKPRRSNQGLQRSNKKVWRCSEYHSYKCKVRIHTKDNEIINESGSHSHEPDEAKIEAKKYLNEKMEKAKSTYCDVP